MNVKFSKLLFYFSYLNLSFAENYDDYNDDDMVYVKKKNRSNRRNNRNGLIHKLEDNINLSININAINHSFLKYKSIVNELNKDIKKNSDSSDGKLINLSKKCLYYCQPSFNIGYKFNKQLEVDLNIGIANDLATQFKKYILNVNLIIRKTNDFILGTKILSESGIGYCLFERRENSLIVGEEDLTQLFDFKLDPLVLHFNVGIKFLFVSVHIGGMLSLGKLTGKEKEDNGISNSDNPAYWNDYNDILKNMLTDITNVSIRIYPITLTDKILGWLI